MSTRALSDIEALVEQLDVRDQVRLLEFLAPRIAGNVLSSENCLANDEQAWQHFRDVGSKLVARSSGGRSMSEAISHMRR
jgi:hypothetical protein